MKKYIMSIIISCFLLINTCGKTYTRLTFVFGKQPEGGVDVTLVDCVIVGRLVDGDTPIQVTVQWLWEDLNHQNHQLYWQDTWTFRSEQAEELPTGVQSPAGYVLVGYFWFQATWEDEDGTPNTVVSDTARCTTSTIQDTQSLNKIKLDQLNTFMYPTSQ
ncbi:MAG: hypothetical protein WBB37_09655 [bacterium]